jgi:hypothetical protein
MDHGVRRCQPAKSPASRLRKPHAAEQARAANRKMTDQLGHLGLDTAISEGVRDLAEKTVAHTREAYDRSMDSPR